MKRYYTKTFTFRGKRYYVKAKTEREAIEKLALKKRDLERGDYLNPRSVTVESWAMEAIETYKIRQSPITRQKYLEKLRPNILRHIGTMKLKDITPFRCQQLLNLQMGKSKSTISTTYQQLQFIFRMAKINGLIAQDPTENLVKPDGTYHPRRALTVSEERYFLKVLPNHHYALYFALMYYAGCRPSEAVSAEGRDIQTKEGALYLHIRGTKTRNADRLIPIVPQLLQLLPRNPATYKKLCLNERGCEINIENRRRAWRSLCRSINIEMGCRVYRNKLIPPFPFAADLSAYSLRHTFCTNLQKRGVDIRTAQYLMGHADIQMTANIYTHVDLDLISQAGVLMSDVARPVDNAL